MNPHTVPHNCGMQLLWNRLTIYRRTVSYISMPHVFISYVREDWPVVEQLAGALKAGGVNVWLDRERLLPGGKWQIAIRKAIHDGNFFIACFSRHYAARESSYMNEELTIAIDELRRRPSERTWFIPVLLDPGTLPHRSIGGGESLHDLQYVALQESWDEGISRLLLVLNPTHAQSVGSAMEQALADLRSRSEQEQEDWVLWAWEHGTPRHRELARAVKGYGLIGSNDESDWDDNASGTASPSARDDTTVKWLRTTLQRFDLESPEMQERWIFHLTGAERREKIDVRVEAGNHYQAADALCRLGALTELRRHRSYISFAMTERGGLLLTELWSHLSSTDD